MRHLSLGSEFYRSGNFTGLKNRCTNEKSAPDRDAFSKLKLNYCLVGAVCTVAAVGNRGDCYDSCYHTGNATCADTTKACTSTGTCACCCNAVIYAADERTTCIGNAICTDNACWVTRNACFTTNCYCGCILGGCHACSQKKCCCDCCETCHSSISKSRKRIHRAFSRIICLPLQTGLSAKTPLEHPILWLGR